MKPKSLEIFIPGPAGRLEAKYYKNPKFGSPVAIVLHPHPQYGGTMNNRIVQLMYNIFVDNGFSVIKVNFRGVGKSEGVLITVKVNYLICCGFGLDRETEFRLQPMLGFRFFFWFINLYAINYEKT